MTRDAQMALRAVMEKSRKLFVLSVNYPHKIIPSIQSRCAYYNFEKLSDKHMMEMFKRIIKGENISLGDDLSKGLIKDLIKLIIRSSGGDMRNFINAIQQIYDEESNSLNPMLYGDSSISQSLIDNVVEFAIKGNLERAMKLVVEHFKHNKDSTRTLELFYEHFEKNLKKYDANLSAGVFGLIAQIDNNLRVGCNPMIQMSSLVAYIWGAQTKRKSHENR